MEILMSALQVVQQYSVVVMAVVFVLLMATVLWPGRGERFERDAQIPLQDDR